eukprot:3189306-Prymnesium_polylepis.1
MRHGLLSQHTSLVGVRVGQGKTVTVRVPDLGMTISMYDNPVIEARYCADAVKEREREMTRIGKAEWMRRGGQWHRPCEASVNHVAESFDVVLVNLGRQYQTHRQQTLPQHG